MPIPSGVKIGVAVACAAAAAFLTFRNMNTPLDENDAIMNSRVDYYRCGKQHEFNLTAKESRKISSENGGVIVCPQCGSSSSEVIPCPHCKKMLDLVGHGMMPETCAFCKQKL